MKMADVKVGQRVNYCFPDAPPRPGIVTVDRRPGGMVTIHLDDGLDVTTIPDLLKLDESSW